MSEEQRNAILEELKRDIADLRARMNAIQRDLSSDVKSISGEMQKMSLTIAKMEQVVGSLDKWKDNTTSLFFKWFGGVAVAITLGILAMIFAGGVDP